MRCRAWRVAGGLLLVLATWLLPGCADEGCDPNQDCSCANLNTCFLGCAGNGCTQDCSHAQTCGTVCNNNCSSSCDNATTCSLSCKNNCVLDCDHTMSCGIICGGGCNATCSNTPLCGVEVGPGGSILCDSVQTCDAVCHG